MTWLQQIKNKDRKKKKPCLNIFYSFFFSQISNFSNFQKYTTGLNVPFRIPTKCSNSSLGKGVSISKKC